MTFLQLESIITLIVKKTSELKEKYIPEDLEIVDYVAIFPQNSKEHEALTLLMKDVQAKNVFSDNGGAVYQLSKAIVTEQCDVSLVKICNPDPSKGKRGYVDFRTNEYPILKEKYLSKTNFMFLFGDGWELIGVEDPTSDVALYIPNIPLSKDLGLS